MKSIRSAHLLRGMIGLTAALLLGPGNTAFAVDEHAHQHGGTKTPPPPFVASTAKPFAQLMDDAMTVMNYGMTAAPMNGESDHDFVTMMISHPQGAVDMAKALLLYTKDPELTNLAQGIITEQQNEIRLMQGWLARHQANRPGASQPKQK